MVVVFVDSTDKAEELLVAGVVVNGELTPVFSLSPVKKVIVSNVPPFLKNDLLLRELSQHGRVVSPMRLIPLGSKSPLLRHVVSFRRQVSMVLNDNKEELKLALRFRVDEFDYTVYVTTDSLKCFGCWEEGHVIRSCPNNTEARRPVDPPNRIKRKAPTARRVEKLLS
uniref:CCHC-type domain-containing protein n=1 Tax=Takifugu rubripes TaxID=31033 RepID=A0A674P4C5_TAKRU